MGFPGLVTAAVDLELRSADSLETVKLEARLVSRVSRIGTSTFPPRVAARSKFSPWNLKRFLFKKFIPWKSSTGDI